MIVLSPLPVPKLFFQPKPWCSTGQASGSGPMYSGSTGAVALAERVAADDQRHRLLVVHRHAGERLADVAGGRQRVGVAVRALRVDVDQAHLHGAERAGQLAVTAVALVAEPRVLRTPEDLLRLPRCRDGRRRSRTSAAPSTRSRTLPANTIRSAHETWLAVLLLDRPQQPAGLVQADVVGPAVERGEALRALAAAAAAVGDAVRAGGVPRHADEQRAVVAVVSRPPVLRVRHDRRDVPLERLDVEARERLGVVVVVVHRVALGRVGVEHR